MACLPTSENPQRDVFVQKKKPSSRKFRACSNQFRAGTINVCTARHDDRLQDITNEVARKDLVICAVQETKRISNGFAIVKSVDSGDN